MTLRDIYRGNLRGVLRNVLRTTYDGDGVVPTDVSQAEYDALMSFYDATGGDSWETSTGWGTDTTVGNWAWITVSDGAVSDIDTGINATGIANYDYEGQVPSLDCLKTSDGEFFKVSNSTQLYVKEEA